MSEMQIMPTNLAHRKMLGKQPFRNQTWLLGRWDEAALLSEIVGWSVGCQNEVERQSAVNNLRARRLITTRRHVAPAGEWEAYALTDAGFDRLADIGYGTMHDDALRAHRWYLTNCTKVAASRSEPSPSPASER